jgi:hypothetical protein
MTDNNKYDMTDLVVSAITQKPLDFETAFDNLVVGRLHSAIEDKKIEIARQMYGYQPEDDSETDQEQELESEE